MKIAVTSTGPTIDDNVEARFGRCAYFLIIDTDTMQLEAIENPNIALGGGAGIQSAQLMSEKGVKQVLTGNCGPNAFTVFGQAGIQVIVGISGPVRNAVEQFKTKAFSSAHFGMNAAPEGPTATGQPMSGMGMGGRRGMGRGMGGGRGMARGMGQGGRMGRGMGIPSPMGMPPSNPSAGRPPSADQSREQELATLKRQAELLKQQKHQLNNKMAQLESSRKAVAFVDSGKCAGCGICEDVCTVNAIKVNGQAIVQPELCTGCGLCVGECPNNAIILTQQKTSK